MNLADVQITTSDLLYCLEETNAVFLYRATPDRPDALSGDALWDFVAELDEYNQTAPAEIGWHAGTRIWHYRDKPGRSTKEILLSLRVRGDDPVLRPTELRRLLRFLSRYAVDDRSMTDFKALLKSRRQRHLMLATKPTNKPPDKE